MHMYGHTNLIALYYFDTDTFYYVAGLTIGDFLNLWFYIEGKFCDCWRPAAGENEMNEGDYLKILLNKQWELLVDTFSCNDIEIRRVRFMIKHSVEEHLGHNSHVELYILLYLLSE